MTVDQFLSWAMAQPDGPRYELANGEAIALAPEPAVHARRKARIWRALTEAIDAAGLPCEALPDGMTVKIDEHTAYEPDTLVHCGEALPDDTVIVPTPVIVVEVLSPSTAPRDTGAKLADYFRLPSLHHYLIVRADRSTVIHHRRADGELIETRIVTFRRHWSRSAGHHARPRADLRLIRSQERSNQARQSGHGDCHAG
jgi:Uma2 family endonuclease